MRIRNPRELGLLLRERRRASGLTQAHLADQIGTSRQWVIHLEQGRPSAELGLVFAALSALGLTCDIDDLIGHETSAAYSVVGESAAESLPAVDLAVVLANATGSVIPNGNKHPIGSSRRGAASD